MPTCVCLRTSMEHRLSVRRECIWIDFYAIGGGIWKRFSTAKTIKMLTPFCILSNAVSPLLCQCSKIWKLYLGINITFSLGVCQNKCRLKDSFKKSRGESLGFICSVCADGNIFWSYVENNHTARYQHCQIFLVGTFHPWEEPGRSKLDEPGFTAASSLMERRAWQPGHIHGGKRWLCELLTKLVGQEGEKSAWTSSRRLTSPTLMALGWPAKSIPCSPKTVSPDVCRGTFHIQTMTSAALTRLRAVLSSTWLYRRNNCASTATTKTRTIPLHEHSSANLFSSSNYKLVHPPVASLYFSLQLVQILYCTC